MTASLPVTEFSSGALLVFILQQLKRIPFFAAVGGWIYTAISVVWALVSTVLVSWEWSRNTSGGGTLTLVVPSLGVAIIAIWHWFQQFAIQETIYQGTVSKRAMPTLTVTPPPSNATAKSLSNTTNTGVYSPPQGPSHTAGRK